MMAEAAKRRAAARRCAPLDPPTRAARWRRARGRCPASSHLPRKLEEHPGSRWPVLLRADPSGSFDPLTASAQRLIIGYAVAGRWDLLHVSRFDADVEGLGRLIPIIQGSAPGEQAAGLRPEEL